MMRLLILTGLSGAGKSKVVDALEDIGWFCVDNLPPRLAPTFANLLEETGEYTHAAIVMDLRAGDMFQDIFAALDEMQTCELLFLEASDEVLAQRFQETRRQHPLCAQSPSLGLIEAIAQERSMLEKLHARADITIDTSSLSPADCKNKITALFAENARQAMQVHVKSFGFKAGTPRDCDLLFDVRCLPNPFYVPELKAHTGQETCVREYVLSFEQSRTLLTKITDLLAFLLPMYQQEGKSSLTISFGCTGGKHRSVLFAEEISHTLKAQGYAVHINHRDVRKQA